MKNLYLQKKQTIFLLLLLSFMFNQKLYSQVCNSTIKYSPQKSIGEHNQVETFTSKVEQGMFYYEKHGEYKSVIYNRDNQQVPYNSTKHLTLQCPITNIKSVQDIATRGNDNIFGPLYYVYVMFKTPVPITEDNDSYTVEYVELIFSDYDSALAYKKAWKL